MIDAWSTIRELLEKIRSTAESLDGKIPSFLDAQGRFHHAAGGGWMDGFWPGLCYLAARAGGGEKFLAIADGYQDYFRQRIKNDPETNRRQSFLPLDHDVGFLFLPTQRQRYQLTGDWEARDMCLRAAELLAGRFHERGGFLRAWDTWENDPPEFAREKRGKAIIDSMLNLPLLFFAAEEMGRSDLAEIACTHAHTMRRYIVRPDGSTFHSFNFDPDTGAPLCGKTCQGYSDDSCWSRGQAWAVYGFALAYKYTREEAFLETACQTADYFLSHLSPDGMAIWDFSAADAPTPFRPWDSSALAVCASGLLELAKLETDGRKHWHAAARLLATLGRKCSAEGTQALLTHCCAGSVYRKGSESTICNPVIGQSLPYGDYFYFEALVKLAGIVPGVF